MTNSEFYEWNREASRAGTLWRAVSAYYTGSEYCYHIRLNGTDYTLPVLTAPQWMEQRDDIDSVLGVDDPNHQFEESSMDAVRERVNRIAYWDTDTDETEPDIEDYVWNAEIIHPKPALDELSIDTSRTTYFSTLTQDERLSSELATGLYNAGLPADATQDQIEQAIQNVAASERDAVAPTLPQLIENVDTVATPFGVNAATVFNTGDGYELVLSKRGPSVAVHPDKLSVIPAGNMELGPSGEPSAYWTTLYEYGEEFFAIGEDDSVLEYDPVADLQDLLDTGDAHLDFTGLTIAASRLGVNVMAVLFIDDPDYYETYIADGIEYNWESAGGEQIALDNGAELADALDPHNCVPPHAVCVYEGLLHLADEYDVDADISLDRRNPPR